MINKMFEIAKKKGYQTVRKDTISNCSQLADAIEENIDHDVIENSAKMLKSIFELMFAYSIENEIYEKLDKLVAKDHKKDDGKR